MDKFTVSNIKFCCFIAVAVVFMAAGWANRPALHSATAATTTPQTAMTTPERIQAAVRAQQSCTPALSNVRFVGEDNTGIGYLAACGEWTYIAIIKQGQIKVDRALPWNGR